MIGRWLGVMATAVLGGCASVLGSTDSEVAVRTNPAGAQCTLIGQGGFTHSLVTPASVTIPHTASPLTVRCRAEGFRPMSQTLRASPDGWMWANGALMVGSAGVIVLGAVVDEIRGAGKSFAEDVEYTLDPDRPRPVKVRTRDGSTDFRVEAR